MGEFGAGVQVPSVRLRPEERHSEGRGGEGRARSRALLQAFHPPKPTRAAQPECADVGLQRFDAKVHSVCSDSLVLLS